MKKEDLLAKINALPDGISISIINEADADEEGSTNGIYPDFHIEVIEPDEDSEEGVVAFALLSFEDDNLEMCQCGHEVPYQFAVSNDETGQSVCMPCHLALITDPAVKPGDYMPVECKHENSFINEDGGKECSDCGIIQMTEALEDVRFSMTLEDVVKRAVIQARNYPNLNWKQVVEAVYEMAVKDKDEVKSPAHKVKLSHMAPVINDKIIQKPAMKIITKDDMRNAAHECVGSNNDIQVSAFISGVKWGIEEMRSPGQLIIKDRWIYAEELPPSNVEVIGFSKAWIDEDFNPNGTRVCMVDDQGKWMSAKWNNDQDSWHTHAEWCCNSGSDFNPTLWLPIMAKPN